MVGPADPGERAMPTCEAFGVRHHLARLTNANEILVKQPTSAGFLAKSCSECGSCFASAEAARWRFLALDQMNLQLHHVIGDLTA